jgi:hypothetical protein
MMKHCRHYEYERGLTGRGSVCAKGIDLSPPLASSSCYPLPLREGVPACHLREEYTDEERAAAVERRKAGEARSTKAYEALKAHGPIPLSRERRIPCPNCEGQLVASRAYNGHGWIQCTTRGCVGPIHLTIDKRKEWPS